MDCATYLELVAAHADGVLAASEVAAAESHRSACRPCARAFEESTETRQLFARRARGEKTPEAIRDRIVALTSGAGRQDVSGRPATSRILMQGAIAAMALLGIGLINGRSPNPMQLVADDVHLVARGEFEPVAGVSAPTTEPSLEAAGWRIVGGREGVWGSLRGTMTVYESQDGATLVLHEMEAGPSFEMPPGGRRVGDRTEYSVDGVLVSVALRGSTVSCLAARLSSGEFHRRVTG